MLSIDIESFFQGTLHPELSKRKDDSLETDLRQPTSTQTLSATPQQSLDPQAAEWSLKSNMLPMDSDEMENWCEGVSHMLLSDAFVPVSEETGENSTDLKVFVLSSPHKNEQTTLSPTKSEETTSEISSDVCDFKQHLAAVHNNRFYMDKSHEEVSRSHFILKKKPFFKNMLNN